MKRILLLSILFLLASCNVIESVSSKPVTIRSEGVEIADGAVIDLAPGDYMFVEAFSGDGKSKVTWSSSDETVAMVYQNGEIYILHGGETTITATSENGKTISFRIRIPIVPHADIYFACDNESRIPRLYINGKSQDQTCKLLDSDELGNVWMGSQEGNKITIIKNGETVLKDCSFPDVTVNYYSLRAKGGKAYLLLNKKDATACHYIVFQADGSQKEGLLDLSYNEGEYPYGNLVAMDQDAQGNLIFWGSIRQEFIKYAHKWTVAPDGTVSVESLSYWDEEQGHYEMMSVPVDATLDADGNTCYLAKGWDEHYEIWKNDKKIFRLENEASIVNSGLVAKMVVRGNDIWLAASEIVRAGEDWWDKDYGLIVYKNGQKQFTAATGQDFGGIGLSVTASGDIYTLHLNSGAIVTKNGTRILSIPIPNCWDPVFAVKE